jgi:hypothetical protein
VRNVRPDSEEFNYSGGEANANLLVSEYCTFFNDKTGMCISLRNSLPLLKWHWFVALCWHIFIVYVDSTVLGVGKRNGMNVVCVFT